ncbi:hypothetical protein [Leptospira kanakyensis]|uniref:Uncharacterized protein n=1 Tax=Leptospira kanakyensis TaxID=2484968 RepID=A0A6N4Q5F4_9LEPT|nr:hypothetical protein [Leptospira kanakyensis]TGK65301.1 hypothetical protein EHQ18_19815 [Leptospira kanakyensis]
MYSIILGTISLASSLITIISFIYLTPKLDEKYKNILIASIVVCISAFVYITTETIIKHEINEYKSEFLIFDAKINSEINEVKTSTYNGNLAKLSNIIGFYERNSNLFKGEAERLKVTYDRYLKYYESKNTTFSNYISQSDVNEIKESVDVSINALNHYIKHAEVKKAENKEDYSGFYLVILSSLFGALFNYIFDKIKTSQDKKNSELKYKNSRNKAVKFFKQLKQFDRELTKVTENFSIIELHELNTFFKKLNLFHIQFGSGDQYSINLRSTFNSLKTKDIDSIIMDIELGKYDDFL